MIDAKVNYRVVFGGIFLVILGSFLYFIAPSKKPVKLKSKAINFVKTKRQDVKVIEVVVCDSRDGLPLNFVYDAPDEYKRQIPWDLGMKHYIEDLDGLRIVCASQNCDKQVLTTKYAKVQKLKDTTKVSVTFIDGDVELSKNNLEYLKSNIRIVGDLYIRDINFLKIPKNFSVIGNVYVINSEGLTFMGDNLIDGHIFLRGYGSIKALPNNVKLTGQIFI